MERVTGPTPLRGANGIAFGPDGRLYVAEYLAGRISAVDVTTGTAEVLPGPVVAPDDLVFGADGSMFVTDMGSGRVWRRDPAGGFTVVAEGVLSPNGIALIGDRLFVDEMIPGGRLLEVTGGLRVLAEGLMMGNAMQGGPDGRLYYPHMLPGEVYRISPDGGSPELVTGEVPQTVAVRFDRDGVLYVLSFDEAGTIHRIENGRRTTITTGVAGLDNAAFDAGNRMFVSSFVSGGIFQVRPDGGIREVIPPGHAGPYGVTVDDTGAVLVADHYRLAGRFQPFAHALAADGDLIHFTSQFGHAGTYDRTSGTSRARAENLDRPHGLAVRPDGTLIIAETGRGRVVAISPDDTLTVLADGLGRPVDVALDAGGRCWVSDEERGTVSRPDDGFTLAKGLDTPQGLTFTGGRLFVVEAGRRRVVEAGSPVRVVATDLPLPAEHRVPPLSITGQPGVPRQFAGLAAGTGGELYLTAAGEGSVLRLTPGVA